ncbi:MAG TPA: MFS transporter [Microlunatus sp.]|nr:MFS transporter [Microlunatus sp.]
MSRPAVVGRPVARTGSQRAVVAACIGNAAEWYDFAVYGAMATVLGWVFFPVRDMGSALTAAFAAYGTALLVRPLGAVIFGRMGDRRGRRSVLVTVVLLMAGATGAVAFLPGYASIGLLAPLALMALRATQGLAAGGELGVAAVFILEHAPDTRRGQTGSWHIATMALGIAAGMFVAGLLSWRFGADGLVAGWWRVAFLLAIPLGVIGLLLRRRIADTDQFTALRSSSRVLERPFRELWRGHRARVARGFCLLAAGSLAFNVFFIFLPNSVIQRHGAALAPTMIVTASALAVAAAAAVTLGRVSDRLGRRPVAIGGAASVAVLAMPMLLLADSGSPARLFIAQTAIAIAVAGVLSIAMVGELFPTPVRSSGLALTAGLATALIGGTAPWLGQVLVGLGAELAVGGYVTVVALLALIALWKWPESAFVALD